MGRSKARMYRAFEATLRTWDLNLKATGSHRRHLGMGVAVTCRERGGGRETRLQATPSAAALVAWAGAYVSPKSRPSSLHKLILRGPDSW